MDLWSAWIVLELREKNSALKLRCTLPCEGQESNWEPLMQEQYRFILEQANEVIYVRKEYHRNCMLERNRYLVDHSSILLAVYNGMRRSGTGATVNYARKMGREIIIIDPITRSITCEGRCVTVDRGI